MSRIRNALREWDPRTRQDSPPDRIERERARLLAAAYEQERERPARGAARKLRWVTAAAVLALTLVAVFKTKTPPRLVETATEAERPPESVQWQMTASNGVRIYWNLTLIDTTGDDR